MAQREYGSKNLKWQIPIKIFFILILLVKCYFNNNDLLLELELFTDDKDMNKNIQIIILVILTALIILSVTFGKMIDITYKVYHSFLILIYIFYILYIFITFLNNFYDYNSVNIPLFNTNLSSILIILVVITSIVFLILELSSKKNNIVDLIIKDNKNKTKKFHIFLDTCINFIIMFVILSIFLKFIK